MARTKQTARKTDAEHQQKAKSSGAQVIVTHKNTNLDILEALKPKLLDRQNECLQGTFGERRSRYELYLKYIPLEQILIWPQLFALQSQEPERTVKFSEGKKSKKEASNVGKGKKVKVIADKEASGATNSAELIQSYYAYEPILNEKVSLIDADISLLEVDAIVVTSDTFLGRKEMASTVFKNAGLDLEKELNIMRQHGRVPEHTGNAVICAGYELPARYVIFVAVPTVMDDSLERALSLCYSSALAFIPLFNIKSIAFPSLGTGGYACPVSKACPVALRTVREWLDDSQNQNLVTRIIFCTYRSEVVEEYKKAMQLFFPLVENGVRGIDMVKVLGKGCENIADFFGHQLKERNILGSCIGLSFAGLGRYLTDLVFWLLLNECPVNDKGTSVGWLSVKTINCTGCIHLTDSTLLCISNIFPNLEEADFSGCILLSEAGILRFLSSLKSSIKHASFAGIDSIRSDLLEYKSNSNERIRKWKTKTKIVENGADKLQKQSLKIIIIRIEGQDEKLPLKMDIMLSDGWNDSSIDLKIIQIDSGCLPFISTLNSVLMIPDVPPDSLCFQQFLQAVYLQANGSPIIFCSSGAKNKIDVLRNRINEVVKDKIKNLDSSKSFIQRNNISNLLKLSNCLNQNPVFYMDPKKFSNFKLPEWDSIFQTASQNYAGYYNSVPEDSINDLPIIFHRNTVASLPESTKNYVLQGLHNGNMLRIGGWFSQDISIFVKLNQLKIKNLRSGKRCVPWLADDIQLILLNEMMDFLSNKYNISDYTQIQYFCDTLVEENAFLLISRPWLNDFKNIPALINFECLPEEIPLKMEGLRASFAFATMPTKQTFIHVFQKLSHFGQICMLSKKSVILHIGCFQVNIIFSSDAKLDLCVTSMNMAGKEMENDVVSKMKTGEREVFALMLCTTLWVLNNQQIFSMVTIDCPFCTEQHKPLEPLMDVNSWFAIKCIKSNSAPIGLCPISLNCAHELECANEVESRCSLCLIEMDLHIDSLSKGLCCLWCSKCHTCRRCIQNILECNKLLGGEETETGDSDYSCISCDHKFPSSGSLKRHMQRWCINRCYDHEERLILQEEYNPDSTPKRYKYSKLNQTAMRTYGYESPDSGNIIKCYKIPKLVKFTIGSMLCQQLQIIPLVNADQISIKVDTCVGESIYLGKDFWGTANKLVIEIVRIMDRYQMKLNQSNPAYPINGTEVEISVTLSKAGTSFVWIPENQSLKPAILTLKQGMLLEAEDPITKEFVVAKISDFSENACLILSHESFDEYEAHIHDKRIRHIDYSAHTAISVQLLKHYNMEPPFDWKKYAEYVSSCGVPFDFFSKDQVIGETDMIYAHLTYQDDNCNVHMLKKLMRLEATDIHGKIRTAYIKEILSRSKVRISFDGSITGVFNCDISSKDLHPIGYKDFKDKEFGFPTSVQENKWVNYLKETGSVPVPYEFFTEEQRQKCPRLKSFDSFSTKNLLPGSEFLSIFREANNKIYNTGKYRSGTPPQGMASFITMTPTKITKELVTNPSLTSALDWSMGNQSLHWLCYHSALNEEVSVCMDHMPFRFAGPHLFNYNCKIDRDFIEAICPIIKNTSKHQTDKSDSMFDFLKIIVPYLIENLIFAISCKLTAIEMKDFKGVGLEQVMEAYHRYTFINYHAMRILFDAQIKMHALGLQKPSRSDQAISDYFMKLASKNLGGKEKMKVCSTASFCAYHKKTDQNNDSERILFSDKNASIQRCISLRDTNFSLEEWNLATQKLSPTLLNHLVSVIYKPRTFDQEHIFELLTNLLTNIKIEHLSYRGCFLENINLNPLAASVYSMTILELSSNPLQEIPPVVSKMVNLMVLLLSNCGLTKLPENIGNLTRLRVLDVMGNLICTLPTSITNLSSLQSFYIGGVPLLGTIKQDDNDEVRITFTWFLRHLGSYNLKTRTKPEDIERELETFGVHNFSQNIAVGENVKKVDQYLLSISPRFDGLPDELWALERLIKLDLSYCMMTSINDSISKLRNLQALHLDYCTRLVTISEQIGALPIDTLTLRGCLELKTPPLEVVHRGTVSVMAYMKRLLSGFQECKRTKLMMVGLGGAGKTSLVKALLSGQYKCNGTTAEEITDGIDIAEWTVRLTVGDQDASINYSVWDFAGQSVYYHTHQFFLSNRAVYMLVWNARLGYEHSGLNFWLSSITCHAPKAPIFVIGTHADQVYRTDLPHAELRRAFPQIVDFHFVSPLNGDGVQELALALYSATLAQQYMGEKIPSVWLKLEKELIDKRRTTQIMSFEEVEKRASQNGLMDIHEIKEALTLLHELGSLQYFPNEFLKGRIVINPQWLVNVMSCLISVKESVIKEGKFQRKDLALIWKEYAPDLHDWLLYLTEEFDLTYSLASEDTIIVPCLLSEDEPSHPDEFTDRNQMKMTYEFEYLPAGLFNRTQTRLSQYSESATVWKKGSILRKNGHIATLLHWGCQIQITVAGPKPQNILFLVNEVIESLVHEFFRGIRFDVLIPCCDCTKAGSTDPHMFSSKQLKRASEMRAPFLQCVQGFHIVALDALKELLPPSTTAEFEQQLVVMAQDLGRLQTYVRPKILVLICADDMRKNAQYPVKPQKLISNLKTKQKNTTVLDVNNETMEFVANKISSCMSIITCVTDHSCSDKQFVQILSYCKQNTLKPVIPVIFSNGDAWKKTAIGLQVSSEIYLDFRKPERYDSKFKELLSRIETKNIQTSALLSQNSSRQYSVFLSYSWANSKQAVRLGTQTSADSLGPVDPRDIEDELSKKGISVWIDVKCAKEGILFEEISLALREAKLFVACVSDQYLVSRNCMLEFRFAVGVLKLPIILCSVGTGHTWQTSEIAMLALNASRVDFQVESHSELQRLVSLVKEHLGQAAGPISEPTPNDTEDADQGAYQELCELSQRKFLQQIVRITTKLRSTIVSYSTPYPRIFYLDLTHSQPPSAPLKLQEFLRNLTFKDFQIHLLCEMSEGSWHPSGNPLNLENLSELEEPQFLGSLQDFFKKSSAYLAVIYPILHAVASNNSLEINIFKLENFPNYLHQIKQIALDQDLEASYNMFHGIIRRLDKGLNRGNMLRSNLHNRQVVWLCPEHQKLARGTISNESIDAEDIGLDISDRPSTSAGSHIPLVPINTNHADNKDPTEKENQRSAKYQDLQSLDNETVHSSLRPSTSTSKRPNSSLSRFRSKLCSIS